MKRNLTRSLIALAALSAATAFAAQSSIDPNTFGRAPQGYVSPQSRVILASGAANVVTTPSGATVTLPAGVHPNSIAAQSYIAKAEREVGSDCTKKGCVPVVGRTADGKYPVYSLQGDLNDANYTSPKANVIYQPDDLPRRMGFVKAEDVGHGLQCDFICKNGAGQVVGLNPQLKKMYGMK